MKQIFILFTICFIPNFFLAQEFDGTIFLKDGSYKIGKIHIPKRADSKAIVFDGNEIAGEQVSLVNININNVPYRFIYSNYAHYKYNKYKESKKYYWFLKVDNIEGDRLEYYVSSTKFKISKKGDLIVEAIGDPPMIMHVIKKKDEKILILANEEYYATFTIGKNIVLKRMIEGYLSDCEKLKNIKTKDLSLEDTIDTYNNCD